MYVCICNAITEKQVRDAAREGARTLTDLQRGLGVATGCGQCANDACSLLDAGNAGAPGITARLQGTSTGSAI